MKLRDYALILLSIAVIALESCKAQSFPLVRESLDLGVFSESREKVDMDVDLSEEVKSIAAELSYTFNLSKDQREAFEYLRKALVDVFKIHSNDTFRDFLSQLDADQVAKIMDNIFEHLCLINALKVSINDIQDQDVKNNFENRLNEAEKEYLRLLREYSDISRDVKERYEKLSNSSNGVNLQIISTVTK
ncbi:BTA121 domain-containing protein surface lipoprotein [Borrelia persica]|uniref:BTA121 domain-containing protein surface lipoprotein n=1 Tax=Borrelia persica TaxID=44448 RepID=UPI000462F182|nr:hypothetical protein [Borrelia persica]